jgi:hypothetical protein
MVGRSSAEREGGLRILVAIGAGGVVFPCWLAAPFGGGFFGYAGSDLVELLPSAHPTTLEFMRWAGAGIMAGLVSACIAPRRRWIIVPPLLVLLEIGWEVLIFLVVGAGDVPRPPGTFQGMCAGVMLGVLAVAACRPGMRRARRLATVALAAVVLLAVPAISAWRGKGDLAAMRESVLPTVERLLGSDMLVNTTPVQWIAVRRRLSDEGALYWHAYGEMRNPRAQIALDWRDNPSRWAAEARGLDGFRVEGMEVNLAAPQGFDTIEFDRQGDAEATRRVLQSAGVRSALAAKVELWQAGDPPKFDAVTTYHGIRYEFDWHTFPFYEFERMHFPPDAILTTCSGTYSASAP